MSAKKGNRWWEIRSSHGRKPLFATPEDLWNAAVEYFEWNEDNPLTKQIVYQGEVTGTENLMRAMTIEGLCLFLDISQQTLINYEKQEDFLDVVLEIRSTIRKQKFEGASAGLLNSNIIARDLGLRDAKEVDVVADVKQDSKWTVEFVNADAPKLD